MALFVEGYKYTLPYQPQAARFPQEETLKVNHDFH
jgi:hypothetical protein